MVSLQIILVHKDIQEKFLEAFVKKVDGLKVTRVASKIKIHHLRQFIFDNEFSVTLITNFQMGLPWQKDVKITPLPEEGKCVIMTAVVYPFYNCLPLL